MLHVSIFLYNNIALENCLEKVSNICRYFRGTLLWEFYDIFPLISTLSNAPFLILILDTQDFELDEKKTA